MEIGSSVGTESEGLNDKREQGVSREDSNSGREIVCNRRSEERRKKGEMPKKGSDKNNRGGIVLGGGFFGGACDCDATAVRLSCAFAKARLVPPGR